MPWKGPVEVYLRFDEDAEPPQPLTGVMTWPTLGDAKTQISGKILSTVAMQFREDRCLTEDCSKLVLGGTYSAQTDKLRTIMTGQAVGPFGLKGRFRLERREAK